MQWFCDRETLALRRRQARRYTFLFGGLCGLMLLVFIVECLLVRTGNAALMLRISYASMIPLGIACMVLLFCFVIPERRRVCHLEGLLSREPAMLEGRFTLTGDSFQIPGSVRVRTVLLETEAETVRLSLDEEWVRFAPPDGSLVRVGTVRKFITGIQRSEETASAKKQEVRSGFAIRVFLRRFLSLSPFFVLWVMCVLVFGGFVFNQITDTSPMHKITIFADTELRNAPELAEKLENVLPSPIRMVKIHPFSYAMLDSSALRRADLYIVPASRAEEYREWFAPLPEELADLSSPEMPEGICVLNPDSGLRTAGEWILYESGSASPESWWLFFSASSVHLSETDRTAVEAARALLSLK